MTSTEIPNRAAFKSAEVCAIAGVQPYVLRTWEAEFPDLGVAGPSEGQRIYRKGDVERVLRLKHLILVEGLTLAGARRKIVDAEGTAEPDAETLLPALLSAEAKKSLRDVRSGLEAILQMLSAEPGRHTEAAEFALRSEADRAGAPAPRAKSKTSKSTKSKRSNGM